MVTLSNPEPAGQTGGLPLWPAGDPEPWDKLFHDLHADVFDAVQRPAPEERPVTLLPQPALLSLPSGHQRPAHVLPSPFRFEHVG